MNLKESRRCEMLARVCAFGKRRRHAFPLSTVGGQMFAEVGRIVAELSKHTEARMSCERTLRSRTQDRVAARKRLRASLQAIHRTALALAIDAPGTDRQHRLPRSRGDQALLNAACMSAQHARGSASAFIAHGLPETFLGDLAVDINRLEQAVQNGAVARTARASARAEVQEDVRASFIALRRLDAVVTNVLRGNQMAVAEWWRARRLVLKDMRPRHSARRKVERFARRPAMRRIA